MSDLDELARAAQQSTHHRPPGQRPAPAHRPTTGNTMLIIVVCMMGGGILLALVVGIIIGRLTSPRMPMGAIPAASPTAIPFGLLGARRDATEDPGFSMGRGDDVYGGVLISSWWTITNESQTPLTIQRLRLNNEFEVSASAVVFQGHILDSKSNALPKTLTIGESVDLVEKYGSSHYPKQVIFADIETDRGNFRYRSGEGLRRR